MVIAQAGMALTEDQYRQLVLDADDVHWELHHGHLREKPPMTWEHNETTRLLRHELELQLPWSTYRVIQDHGRVRRSSRSYYIPDLYVVPVAMARRLFHTPGMLEAYPEPLPLVVEVWSPSTGAYDVEQKLQEYQARGDAEIWLVHPYEHTLTTWRRQADGSYTRSFLTGGTIAPAALPGVTVNLARIFV